jgi:hypothetical protein
MREGSDGRVVAGCVVLSPALSNLEKQAITLQKAAVLASRAHALR